MTDAMLENGELSHELRSSLNTILGFGEILSESDGLSEEQIDAIRRIQRGSKSLAGGILETLNLTKIGTALAHEVALTTEKLRQHQMLINATWAAIALLVGWSLISHQFAVKSATEAANMKLSVAEFRLDRIDHTIERHETSVLHERIRGRLDRVHAGSQEPAR